MNRFMGRSFLEVMDKYYYYDSVLSRTGCEDGEASPPTSRGTAPHFPWLATSLPENQRQMAVLNSKLGGAFWRMA
jgi:hypothetical protein